MELQALLDTKKEYIELLCDVFGEAMVACLDRIYKASLTKPDSRGKSILAFFQEEIGRVATWNQAMIQDEFAIARKKSGCKYIADLIKAVLITYVKISLVSNSNVVDSSKIKLRVPSAENFYHRCLLLFAREVWKQPYLMYHKVRSIELQQNLNELESIARKCIRAAIRNFVPIDQLVRDVSLDTPAVATKEDDSSESESESASESEDASETSVSASDTSENESEALESIDDEDENASDGASEYEHIVEQSASDSEEEDVAEKVIPEPFVLSNDVKSESEEETENITVDDDKIVEKEIEITQDDKRVSYDAEDPALKDIDIMSIKDEPEDPNVCDVDKVVIDEEASLVATVKEEPDQKKRIILGSMLINKHRSHKFIKPPNKKPGASDAFF